MSALNACAMSAISSRPATATRFVRSLSRWASASAACISRTGFTIARCVRQVNVPTASAASRNAAITPYSKEAARRSGQLTLLDQTALLDRGELVEHVGDLRGQVAILGPHQELVRFRPVVLAKGRNRLGHDRFEQAPDVFARPVGEGAFL